jgi:hypothetical protein
LEQPRIPDLRRPGSQEWFTDTGVTLGDVACDVQTNDALSCAGETPSRECSSRSSPGDIFVRRVEARSTERSRQTRMRRGAGVDTCGSGANGRSCLRGAVDRRGRTTVSRQSLHTRGHRATLSQEADDYTKARVCRMSICGQALNHPFGAIVVSLGPRTARRYSVSVGRKEFASEPEEIAWAQDWF